MSILGVHISQDTNIEELDIMTKELRKQGSSSEIEEQMQQ